MKQELINLTITPPCILLMIFGLYCVLQGVRQFKEVHKFGQFGDKLSFTAFFGGVGVIIMAILYFFLWVVWR